MTARQSSDATRTARSRLERAFAIGGGTVSKPMCSASARSTEPSVSVAGSSRSARVERATRTYSAVASRVAVHALAPKEGSESGSAIALRQRRSRQGAGARSERAPAENCAASVGRRASAPHPLSPFYDYDP